MKKRLPFLAEIADESTRENFKDIDRTLYNDPIFKGKFVFFEKNLSATSYPATITIYHKLGFVPMDIIPTHISGGTVTWNYSAFTLTTISVTISAATHVRFFAGRYEEN